MGRVIVKTADRLCEETSYWICFYPEVPTCSSGLRQLGKTRRLCYFDESGNLTIDNDRPINEYWHSYQRLAAKCKWKR